MHIAEASEQQRSNIIALLQSQKLPTGDLPFPLKNFYVAVEGGELIGLVGMERYGNWALLRSLVVHPGYRNRQVAEKLVQWLEANAAASGIAAIYLLTETAEHYFERKGFRKISREAVPEGVKQSSEFSHVCPASATVMLKRVAGASLASLPS